MSGMWKRSHGRTSEAPPDERGGYRYVRPTATASHLDSTLPCRSRCEAGTTGCLPRADLVAGTKCRILFTRLGSGHAFDTVETSAGKTRRHPAHLPPPSIAVTESPPPRCGAAWPGPYRGTLIAPRRRWRGPHEAAKHSPTSLPFRRPSLALSGLRRRPVTALSGTA